MTGKGSTQPGKHSGDDTTQDEKGEVSQHTGSRGECPSNKKLSQIMEKSSCRANQNRMPFPEYSVYKNHDKQTQKAAGETVKQTHQLTKQQGGKQNAGDQNHGSFPGRVVPQEKERDNIC